MIIKITDEEEWDDRVIENSTIEESNACYVILRGCTLKNVEFLDVTLDKVQFSHVTSKVTFENCDMPRIEFGGTKLRSVDLSTCNIEGISVQLEDIKGLKLSTLQAITFSKMLGIIVKE